jgi:Metallo-peptidase family M12/Reprolysin family propeptide/Domain of unknown function (DUF4214)
MKPVDGARRRPYNCPCPVGDGLLLPSEILILAGNEIFVMKELLRSQQSRSKRTTPRSLGKRFRAQINVPIILTLTVLGLAAGLGLYSPSAGAQSGRARYQQDIEQVFSGHEDVTLDPQAAMQRVRESGRLSLVTAAHDFEIQLRPNDLRAPNYRAEEVVDGVTRQVPMPGISTYKGSVEGMAGTDARFTIDGEHVEGMILTPQDSYFVESARKYSAVAGANDYLLYKASDVRPEITRSCGTLDEEISRSAKDMAPSVASGTVKPEVFSPFKVVEIATEADGEYTRALGGSANANNDILGVMNGIQAIYQRDIGLTFTVVLQHTWTDPATDPYTVSGDAPAMLQEFTTVWQRDFPANNPVRDVAHLWTGRALGGPAGIAWTGVVCVTNGDHSYGLSDQETTAPFRFGIPAHEIGHNFNATHCDGQAGCANTIMVATQDQNNNQTFCPFSINEITSFVNQNSSCLTNAPAGNPIDGADFFVRQHYQDFLNRTPDASGLAFWTNEITSCGNNQACIDAKRVNVSAAFFLSIEFQQTGYLVERLYKTAFGDGTGTSTFNGSHQMPVPIIRFNEFLPDTQQIGQGVVIGQPGADQLLENNKVAFINQFVARTRFTNKYPVVPPAADPLFVKTLNDNAANPLSTSEVATLSTEYTTGAKSRAVVLRQIAEHQNLVNSESNRAFVLMQYFGYLRRNPNDPPEGTLDYTGYDFWLTKLNQFNGNFVNADMVKAFIVSGEYRKRFGTP